MKRVSLSIILFVGFLYGQSSWTFPEDSTTIGIMVYDFETLEFEGGDIQNYVQCEPPDSFSLPIEFTYQEPMDFGWELFTYPCTGDTVFFASVVWAGMGAINIPSSLTHPDSFRLSQSLTSTPLSTSDIGFVGNLEELPGYVAGRDSVLSHLMRTEVLGEFEQFPYHLIVHFYPPSVGLLDPSVAKFVLMLIRMPLSETSIQNAEDIAPKSRVLHAIAYPNPFNPTARIKIISATSGHMVVYLTDVTGRRIGEHDLGYVAKGASQVEFSPEETAAGIVIYSILLDGKVEFTGKVLYLR